MPLKCLNRGKGFNRLLRGGGFFLLTSLPVTALTTESTLQPPTPETREALVIDDTAIPMDAIERMHALVQRDDPALDREQFLDAIIESHLVADHVRDQGMERIVLDSHGVGFSADVQIDNRQVATLRALFSEPLSSAVEALGEDGLNALLVAPLQPDMESVAAALGSPVRHVYQLSDKERAATQQVVLARYRLPGKKQQVVTLADIYQRQNVQGRIALHQGDHTWLLRETQLLIGQQFVRAWLDQQPLIAAETIDAINLLVEDRMLRQAWLAHTGVANEIHAGNPALKAESSQVSRDDIQRWYNGNQERFRRVTAALATVVWCSEKAACEAWRADHDAGDNAAQQTDNADDAGIKVSTAWYKRGQGRDWLTDVVLMHPDAATEEVLRAPDDAGWHLVRVEQRRWHTHGVDSLTVDTVARREIARERLVQRYVELTGRLKASAKIVRPHS